MFKHDCKIHGHRYEARYDSKLPEKNLKVDISGITPSLVNSFKEKTYIHDICTRCGNIVKK